MGEMCIHKSGMFIFNSHFGGQAWYFVYKILLEDFSIFWGHSMNYINCPVLSVSSDHEEPMLNVLTVHCFSIFRCSKEVPEVGPEAPTNRRAAPTGAETISDKPDSARFGPFSTQVHVFWETCITFLVHLNSPSFLPLNHHPHPPALVVPRRQRRCLLGTPRQLVEVRACR